MTAGDHALLREITEALNAAPFASTIEVFGQRISRPTARSMEASLLRHRMTERRRLAA